MKYFVLLFLGCMALCSGAFAMSCEGLMDLPLRDGRITMAIAEPAGTVLEMSPDPIRDLPAFCRVAATLAPSGDSSIKVEVWMPVATWNGKYEGSGNGGYAGTIAFRSLAEGIHRGYAVANTDMGTSRASGQDADGLVGHPERWQDWGSRSTHEMTVAAKQIIEAFYGKPPAFSYFVGCSTGGQQGLVEAQRFPNDYDGIAAGAPANNRTRLHMGFIWDFAAANAKPASNLTPATLSAISRVVLGACVAQKAVVTDGFLSNPAACQWDPDTLVCRKDGAQDCITAEQAATVRKLYDGPRNPVTHAFIYPGLARGSESDWNHVLPPNDEPIYDALFKWTFGAGWSWRTFDFNRDVAAVDARLAAIMNATDPDLQAFKNLSHKLIVYHGWADAIVPSLESINYYQSVEREEAKPSASQDRPDVEETQKFFRLFMVPGMAHCSGGPGLNVIDPVESLVLWVEKGIAPKRIIAKRVENGAIEMTRPVCPYPEVARYKGAGDSNDAANFSCFVAPPEKKK
jgi:feruloyl esterase